MNFCMDITEGWYWPYLLSASRWEGALVPRAQSAAAPLHTPRVTRITPDRPLNRTPDDETVLQPNLTSTVPTATVQ